MKNATKGALAAAAAGSLLLGGAGSLAYWTGTGKVTGGSIGAGDISLAAPTCSGTSTDGNSTALHDWQYDGGSAFSVGTSKVVPGDSLSKVCEMVLTMSGDYIGATLGIATPAFSSSNGLTSELTKSAVFTVDGASGVTSLTRPGTYKVVATVTVGLDGASATNGSKNLSSVLNDITLTATQTHDTTAN